MHFAEAIEHYNEFLENSPRHPEHGKARVQLALARIRQATEANKFSDALEIAPKELEAVEDEEDLQRRARRSGIAAAPDRHGSGEAGRTSGRRRRGAEKLVEQSKTALELCNNIVYIPKSLRFEASKGSWTEVREILRRVEHREQSHQALQETLAAMDKAVGRRRWRQPLLAAHKSW